MKQQKASRISPVFSMILFSFLLVCILILTMLGSGVYQNLTEQQQKNNSSRTVLRYLSTAVHGADRENCIRLRSGPQGDALILTDPSTNYETRIYLSQQTLVEEFAIANSGFAPQMAQPIGNCTRFEVSFSTPHLLSVTTNEGTVKIALHTAQGGTA